MSIDDLDDILSTADELEARFRELESQVELDAMRAEAEAELRRRPVDVGPAASIRPETEADPLAAMKATLDGQGPARVRYMTVLCPSCEAKNRVPLDRVRHQQPMCGACRTDLAYAR
jgi:hypothetical protein